MSAITTAPIAPNATSATGLRYQGSGHRAAGPVAGRGTRSARRRGSSGRREVRNAPRAPIVGGSGSERMDRARHIRAGSVAASCWCSSFVVVAFARDSSSRRSTSRCSTTAAGQEVRSVVCGGLVLVIGRGGGGHLDVDPVLRCRERGIDEVQRRLLRLAELARHDRHSENENADHHQADDAGAEDRGSAVVPGLF